MAPNELFARWFQEAIDSGLSPSKAMDYADENLQRSRGECGEFSRGAYRLRTAKSSDFKGEYDIADKHYQPDRSRKTHHEGAGLGYSYQSQERFDASGSRDGEHARFRYAEPQKSRLHDDMREYFLGKAFEDFSFEDPPHPEPHPHQPSRRDDPFCNDPFDFRAPGKSGKSSRKGRDSSSSFCNFPCFPGFSQPEQRRKAQKHQRPQQRYDEDEFGHGFRQSDHSAYVPPSPPRFHRDPVFEDKPYKNHNARYRYQQPGDYQSNFDGDGHGEMPQRPEPSHHQSRPRPRPQQARTERPREAHAPPAEDEALPDYYGTLGVPSSATPAAIKKAYMQLALKYHPDRVEEKLKSQVTDRMAEINVAYGVLSDGEQRRVYDLGRR